MLSGKGIIYDVFLSFHGPDTRKNFTSHLSTALKNANIKTFIDRNIPIGDYISSSLIQAIETSKIAIIVFSPNSFNSQWCMDELVKILECKHARGQLVIPIFWRIDPSDFQKQADVFQLRFADLEEKFRDDLQKVERWRSSFFELTHISGWHINESVDEAEVIQQIVEEVSSRLLESKWSRILFFGKVKFYIFMLLLFDILFMCIFIFNT